MSFGEEKRRVRVLCVDDEPQVLEGLALHLRRHYELSTATSGRAALDLIAQDPGAIAVIMSDMRMPSMDGATFLAKARELAPDAARILLTGQADLASAIAAVNEGQIFRFLTKPCPPPTVLAAFAAGAEQHRLLTSERVLLEQTLHGSIKTLTDVLAHTCPLAFGRTVRVRRLATELAAKVALRERWQLDVAAMLSQLACITLPQETLERLYHGLPTNDAEQKLIANLPAVTEQLLASIPRLEPVREILASSVKPAKKSVLAEFERASLVDQAAQLLHVAADFDELEARCGSVPHALDTMRGREERYPKAVLAALFELRGQGGGETVRELPVAALRVGMVLAEDVRMTTGTLLASRGYEVTPGFAERARNFHPGTVREPVRVVVRKAGELR